MINLSSCLYFFVDSDLLTGSVGSPLPGVEVRIVMNNTNNTTIVEGNQKETQVSIFFLFFFIGRIKYKVFQSGPTSLLQKKSHQSHIFFLPTLVT